MLVCIQIVAQIWKTFPNQTQYRLINLEAQGIGSWLRCAKSGVCKTMLFYLVLQTKRDVCLELGKLLCVQYFDLKCALSGMLMS